MSPERGTVPPVAVLDDVHAAAFVTDADGVLTGWNRHAELLYGFTPEEAIGRNVLSLLVGSPDREPVAEILEVLRSGLPWQGELPVRRRSGEAVPAYLVATPVADDTGRLAGIVGAVFDLRPLRRSEERARLALEGTETGVWEWDVAADRIVWSENLGPIHGLAPGAAPETYQEFTELVHPDDRALVAEAVERAVERGERFEIRFRALAPDGSVRRIEARAHVLLDEEGRPARLVGVSQDASARLRAEEELRDTKEALQALVAASPVPIVAYDRDGRVTRWNPAAERVFGWTQEEVLGRPLPSVPEERRAELDEIRRRALAGEAISGYETTRQRRDGSLLDVSLWNAPVRDARGEVREVVVLVSDITERTRAERRLRAEHAVAQVLAEAGALTDAIPAVLEAICVGLGWDWGAVWAVDAGAGVLRFAECWSAPDAEVGALVDLSRTLQFERGVGFPGRVWDGEGTLWIPDVLAEDNFPRRQAAAAAGLHAALGFTILVRREVVGVIEFFSREIREPDEELLQMMAAVGSQIGQLIERVRGEHAVRASEARKGAILEAALDCVVTIDAEGRLLELNPAAERTFGYRRDEVLGLELAELMVPPALRPRHREGLARYLATGESSILDRRIEIEGMRSDGSCFPVELAVTRVDLPGPPVFTAYLRDITDRRREQERARLLADVSETLAVSLDRGEILERVARLTVPALADWCAVHLVGPGGGVQCAAILHRDPASEELARELETLYPPREAAGGGLTTVLDSGRAELHADLAGALPDHARDPRHLELLRALGPRSAIAVPLRARGRVLGSLTLVSAASGRRYGAAELRLAEEVARRTALAVDNALLHDAERRARADAERAARRIARLQGVTARLAGALTSREVAEILVQEGRTALEAVAGWVSMLNEERSALELLAASGYSPEFVEAYRRIPADAALEVAACVRDGRARWFESIASAAGEHPELAEAAAATGGEALAIVPLARGGLPAGFVALRFAAPRPFDDDDRALLSTLAAQCSQALERARLYEREHAVAETLQRSMLPARLPRLETVRLAARYLPGSPGIEVGGDWYDAVELDRGRLALAIGDVAGRGLGAAARMGQLRTAVRAFAVQGSPPREVLGWLNALDWAVGTGEFATVAYLELDCGSGECRFATAGHLPPLVLVPGGGAELLDGGRSVPLGVDPDAAFVEARVSLVPGAALLLYTDGLVERRGELIDEGIARLARAAASGPHDLERLLDHLLAELLGEERGDDVALLAARYLGDAGGERA